MKRKVGSALKKAEHHLLSDNKDARKEIKEHKQLVKTLKSSVKGRKK